MDSVSRNMVGTYVLHTLFLFTRSDLRCIVGPKSAFGLTTAICASTFGIQSIPSAPKILSHAPLIIFWLWINLLGLNIGNQRPPAVIEEDALNKPWRPLPSKRITATDARFLLHATYAAALIVSLFTGGFRQSLGMLLLGCLHNDLGGADYGYVTRNMINGFGLVSFVSGSMEVALGFALPVQASLMSWFLIIGAVVFTTVQSQDMYDQEGDRLKGRRTLPLMIGDGLARWTIAVPVMLWSVVCPLYWASQLWVRMMPFGLGSILACRCLTMRTVRDDKVTFAIWSL